MLKKLRDKIYIVANRIYHGVFAFFKAMLHWRHPVMVQGERTISRLPELLRASRAQHPLLVTDPYLRDHLAPQVEAILRAAGLEYSIFSDLSPNPTVADCAHCRDAFVKYGCDSFIAFGGGAPMDTAKAAGALYARPKKTLQSMNGLMKVGRELPPFIAIPTTAGTGSETTVAAVIPGDPSQGVDHGHASHAEVRDPGPQYDRGPAALRHGNHRYGRAGPRP